MNKLLLLTTCALIGILKSQAQTEKFYHFQEENKNIVGKGMSPNGKYVVGTDATLIVYGNSSESGLSSFRWNLEQDTKEWMTVADVNQLEKTGCFNDINDEGIIVGYYKNPENKITFTQSGTTATMPINTAAVWVDGKITSLGLGSDLKLENCTKFGDGTIATAISNDGKTIVGKYVRNNAGFPCLWKKTTDGTWQYQTLELPSEEGVQITKGNARDVSADGSIIVGEIDIKGHAIVPVYWKDGKINRISTAIEDTIYAQARTQSFAASVSQNGEYISVVFGRNDMKVLAVYSVSKKTYVKTEQIEKVNSVESAPIADNGNTMHSFSCGSMLGGGVYYRSMWYSYANSKTMDFDYFMKVYAPEAEPPFSFNVEDKPVAFTTALSADGFVVMGTQYAPIR